MSHSYSNLLIGTYYSTWQTWKTTPEPIVEDDLQTDEQPRREATLLPAPFPQDFIPRK